MAFEVPLGILPRFCILFQLASHSDLASLLIAAPSRDGMLSLSHEAVEESLGREAESIGLDTFPGDDLQ